MLKAYYIKTSDEQALWSALWEAGLALKDWDETDQLNQAPELAPDNVEWEPTGKFSWVKKGEYDLDIIGVIYKPTEAVDAEGNPVMEQLDGYHANIRKWDGDFTEEQLAALPLIVPPNKPVRIWAGD
jgi:hypothetical protein